MTREEAKELQPIIQAWLEGKQIQYRDNEGWKDLRKDFCPIAYDEVRIKPEPKYRPFKTQEECWNEMLKHHPFGWIRSKHTNILYQINIVDDDTIYLNRLFIPYSNVFDNDEFIDGTPFGIKDNIK